MEWRILGPLEVVTEAGPVALGGPRRRGLLSLLLCQPNTFVPRDRLIDLLWGLDPPASAQGALQVHVHGLRRSLGTDRVLTRGVAYAVAVRPGELDLQRFEHQIAHGRERLAAGDAGEASQALGAALALWRGRPWGDLPEGPFKEAEVARLNEQRLAALEDRIEADLRLGRHAELVAELRALVEENPFRERPHRQLMLALYRTGRQAEALNTYQNVRRLFVEQLGLEPGNEIEELQAAILRQDGALASEPYELRARRHLPAPVTELIGRQAQIDEVIDLMSSPAVRLLTLTGPGGIGKSRLGLRVAFDLAPRFPDGVFFVGLAPARASMRVPSLIAQALGLSEQGDRPLMDTLHEHLKDRRLLLLLDNFEHVEEAAPTVGELLSSAAEVKVLVTSRTPLRIYGEHLYPVPPLHLRAEAVPLFVARARAVTTRLPADATEDERVARVCEALDGLPLAIELAAARAGDFSLDQMAEMLDSRLDLAAEGPRDLDARHRALRATIGWSYDLLDELQRSVFRRLAVFSGTFSESGAEEICGADARSLRSLVERNLVTEETGLEQETRYSLLETIREFALEQLIAAGELEDTKARHARHYAEIALRADSVSRAPGAERTAALRHLETEMDNIVGALEWSLGADNGHSSEGRSSIALRIAGSMAWTWWVLGRVGEGRAWIDRALSVGPTTSSPERARCLHAVGILADLAGDLERPSRCVREAIDVFEEMGDKPKTASALNSLAIITRSRGDLEGARALLESSLTLRQELDDLRGVAMCLSNLGVFALDGGDLAGAESLLERARTLNRRLEDDHAAASDAANLGAVVLEGGDAGRAAALLSGALGVIHESGDLEGVAETLGRLAAASAGCGELQRAARLFGASDALMREVGVGAAEFERARLERYRMLTREQLGEQEFARAVAEGEAMGAERAVAFALGPGPEVESSVPAPTS